MGKIVMRHGYYKVGARTEKGYEIECSDGSEVIRLHFDCPENADLAALVARVWPEGEFGTNRGEPISDVSSWSRVKLDIVGGVS